MKLLFNEKLLNDDLTNIVLTSKSKINSIYYGYGCFIQNDKIFHSGDGTGISANISYYLKGDYILSILSNYSNPSANNIIKLFENIYYKSIP